MEEEKHVRVTSMLSLETIGIITGIVLCILQGVGTINIGWFWATFPFWICLAVDLAIALIVLLIVGIVALIAHHRERRY